MSITNQHAGGNWLEECEVHALPNITVYMCHKVRIREKNFKNIFIAQNF